MLMQKNIVIESNQTWIKLKIVKWVYSEGIVYSMATTKNGHKSKITLPFSLNT